MNFKEISFAAANGSSMPEGQPLDALWTYTVLKIMYDDVKSGKIDRETAKAKQQEIKNAYVEAVQLREHEVAAYAQYQEFIRLGSEYIYKIRDAVKERADAPTMMKLALGMYSALSGDSTVSDTLMKQMEEPKK